MARQAVTLAGPLLAAYLACKEQAFMRALQNQTTTKALPAARHVPLLLVAAVAVVAALLFSAGVLWAKYGTAVFFEMIAAGIAACF